MCCLGGFLPRNWEGIDLMQPRTPRWNLGPFQVTDFNFRPHVQCEYTLDFIWPHFQFATLLFPKTVRFMSSYDFILSLMRWAQLRIHRNMSVRQCWFRASVPDPRRDELAPRTCFMLSTYRAPSSYASTQFDVGFEKCVVPWSIILRSQLRFRWKCDRLLGRGDGSCSIVKGSRMRGHWSLLTTKENFTEQRYRFCWSACS